MILLMLHRRLTAVSVRRLDIDRSVRQTFRDDLELFARRFGSTAGKYERDGGAARGSEILLYRRAGRVLRAGAPSKRARSRADLQSPSHNLPEGRTITHKQYY